MFFKFIKNKLVQKYSLTFLGIVFILVGASRGEVQSVLSKAIKLCMECVGIG